MSRLRLDGRTVLVTGGAHGIGLALSRRLLDEGAAVIAVGRNRERVARLEAQFPGRAHGWIADLSNAAEVDALVRDLPALHPDLSIVVNNAAVQTETDFVNDAPSDLRAPLRSEIALNFDAVVALSSGLLPVLKRHPAPAIVNITSGLALAPKAGAPVYCATKAAVRSFTKAVRYQCEDRAPHVRIVEAVMALVDTDMTAGRGRGKITPERAADEVIDGLKAGHSEIYVDRAKLLRTLMRVAPGVGEKLMRGG
jgi:uncharacterized oxidoreductase